MFRALIHIVVPVLLLQLAKAQPKAELAVRFLAQAAPSDLGRVSLAIGDIRTDAFELPVNNLSLVQKTAARGFLLWQIDKNRSISQITLPEDGQSFIVLLLLSPKGGYSPVVMRADDPNFKPGDIYFHNNSPKSVVGYVGTSKFLIRPAQGTVVRPAGTRAEKFYDVGIGVREETGDRVLTTTRWPEDPMSRFYVFFYVDPVTQLVAYRAVDEFVPPVAPKP